MEDNLQTKQSNNVSVSESGKRQKEAVDVLVINLVRLKCDTCECTDYFTVLINITRTPPQIPISLLNINSLIIAAVQDRF